MLDQAIRDRLKYDPETGKVTRLDGEEFGRPNKNGYIQGNLSVNGKKRTLLIHRVGWFLHYGSWPAQKLDHRNRVRHDNRIDNLREVDDAMNAQNRRSGVGSGVLKRGESYQAYIRIEGRKYGLGSYPTMEMAERVYTAVKREFHPGAAHWDPAPAVMGTPVSPTRLLAANEESDGAALKAHFHV